MSTSVITGRRRKQRAVCANITLPNGHVVPRLTVGRFEDPNEQHMGLTMALRDAGAGGSLAGLIRVAAKLRARGWTRL